MVSHVLRSVTIKKDPQKECLGLDNLNEFRIMLCEIT